MSPLFIEPSLNQSTRYSNCRECNQYIPAVLIRKLSDSDVTSRFQACHNCKKVTRLLDENQAEHFLKTSISFEEIPPRLRPLQAPTCTDDSESAPLSHSDDTERGNVSDFHKSFYANAYTLFPALNTPPSPQYSTPAAEPHSDGRVGKKTPCSVGSCRYLQRAKDCVSNMCIDHCASSTTPCIVGTHRERQEVIQRHSVAGPRKSGGCRSTNSAVREGIQGKDDDCVAGTSASVLGKRARQSNVDADYAEDPARQNPTRPTPSMERLLQTFLSELEDAQALREEELKAKILSLQQRNAKLLDTISNAQAMLTCL